MSDKDEFMKGWAKLPKENPNALASLLELVGIGDGPSRESERESDEEQDCE